MSENDTRMTKLKGNLISGIKKIDELTYIIHDSSTPDYYKKLMEELRDRRMEDYEYSCNYSSQHWDLVFKLNNHGQAPIITYGIKTFDLPKDYKMELAEWTHPALKLLNLEKLQFIYIKSPDGKMIFRQDDQYHIECLFDENQNLNITDSGKNIINDVLVTSIFYHLHELSKNTNNSPESTFNYITKNYENTRENVRWGHDKSSGVEAIIGHWRNGIEDLIFKK